MVLPLDLDQIIARADRIFVGRCVDEREEFDRYGLPVTRVTFAVMTHLKGVEGDEITVTHFGHGAPATSQALVLDVLSGRSGIVAGGHALRRAYDYAPGEAVVLFLYPDSAIGLTSPVGYGQGLFRIHEEDFGGRTVQNAFGNIFLNQARAGITASLSALDNSQALSRYDSFLKAVKARLKP